MRQALVSSTPDDGPLKSYAKAPERIVPFLRPYRSREDMLTWHSEPAVQAHAEDRLRRGVYATAAPLDHRSGLWEAGISTKR
ncbi:MAG TPA: hypothetical protein VLK82_10885 [Candidatus Tectomicrobia bacterium]|nr:hypothetical protein [Candidatus Tectomicrobia bacterium]